MCGRYAIAPSRKDAWATMGDQLGENIEAMLNALEPLFNIAPTTQIPIIRQNPATRAITAARSWSLPQPLAAVRLSE